MMSKWDKLEAMKVLESTAQWHLHDFDIAKTELFYVTTESIFGADSRFTKECFCQHESEPERSSFFLPYVDSLSTFYHKER